MLFVVLPVHVFVRHFCWSISQLTIERSPNMVSQFIHLCMSQLLLLSLKIAGVLLSTHSLLEHTDVSILFHNEDIYNICRHSLDIELPTCTLIASSHRLYLH